jgi:biopolymer transport protein ExbD
VEDAIDAVRTSGVDNVGLLTQKKEAGTGGGE